MNKIYGKVVCGLAMVGLSGAARAQDIDRLVGQMTLAISGKCMKYLLLLTTCALFVLSAVGQSPGGQFVLNGKINIDTGEAYLLPVSNDSSYYPTKKMFDKTTISKGKFVISGPCPQPSMFMIRVDVDSVGKYVSDYFIVKPGIQDITCNVDSIREIPGITNKYMDGLKSKRGEPYVILWELIEKLIGRGYEPELDSAYHSLPVTIRSSFAGKVFAKEMATMRRFAVGTSFPELALLDTNLNKVKIVVPSHRLKYILIDFWYSHCGPCLREFEELKKIYKVYEPYGFAVAAVSTDDKKSIQDWKRVIRERQLPWPQYLDMGGGQASRLLIKGFPTTFLLDSHGRIVKRDLDLKSLNLFLQTHIQ